MAGYVYYLEEFLNNPHNSVRAYSADNKCFLTGPISSDFQINISTSWEGQQRTLLSAIQKGLSDAKGAIDKVEGKLLQSLGEVAQLTDNDAARAWAAQMLFNNPDVLGHTFNFLDDTKAFQDTRITTNSLDISTIVMSGFSMPLGGTSVRSYLDKLVDYFAGDISITNENVHTIRPPKKIGTYEGLNINELTMRNSYTIMYGNNILIKNIIPTTLNITIPPYKTVDGDYYYAKIQANFEYGTRLVINNVKNWINQG